ncbi:hypothetical protein HHI36_015311 [Cryptolaemus montrouzieri]|uniref:Cytochrome P450 n=1 Tax=Cryptolaemus montrouzieri TaxID=559131 RepID=A0ABD2N597_9CUCU
MIEIILLILSIILLYYVVIRPLNYWSKKNVQTGTVIPFFGDNFYVLLGRESMTHMVERIYNKVQGVRFIGAYQFLTPMLFVKSPEVIKNICVKDFDHFVNHRTFFPDDADELWSKNLISLKGQTWKDMRSTVSPTFTSSKMRAMYVLISQKAELFVQYFLDKKEDFIKTEMKEAYRRYTADVIASTAFGLEVNSLKDKDNEFYKMGTSIANFSTFRKKLTFFMFQISHLLAKILGLALLTDNEKYFFMNLVKDTIEMREKQNIKRPDMLGILMEAKNERAKAKSTDENKRKDEEGVIENVKQDLTVGDITSQALIFFIAGFDAVSSQMCFIAYELAINPDVQKKLIEEIDRNRPANSSPSYETLLNMSYLDQVILEAQRKWPIAVVADRVVTKPYTIEPELPGEKPVHLEVGENIWIPIYAIHHDPNFYENPDKFDPERFSPENKKNIDPYSYIPFGVGPRNCIGNRFALLEIKAVFFHLLSHFEIVPVEETNIPLRISKSAINLTSENNFPLGLKKRK